MTVVYEREINVLCHVCKKEGNSVMKFGEDERYPDDFALECSQCGNWEEGSLPLQNFEEVQFKTYILVDLQDVDDMREVTLDGAKEFLADMWYDVDTEHENNMSRAELQEHLDNIFKADAKELDELLSGCDYTLLDDMIEYEEYKKNLN